MKCDCPKNFVWYKNGQPVKFCSLRCEYRAYKNADLPRPHIHGCPLCEEAWECTDESCVYGRWDRRGRLPKQPIKTPCECCDEVLDDCEDGDDQMCDDNSDFLIRAQELGYGR